MEFRKFKIREFFNFKRKFDSKSFFKYLNLELCLGYFLKEKDFFHENFDTEGLEKIKHKIKCKKIYDNVYS